MTTTAQPISHNSAKALFPVRDLYRALLAAHPGADTLRRAADFLDTQLATVDAAQCPLPDTPDAVLDWVRREAVETTQAFARYREARQAGGPRRYFSNRSHALYFLRGVAPTKLVDGAWLYGVLPRRDDVALLPLVQTYLEELGSGEATQNHVRLYRRLLAENGCDDLTPLSDAHYVQGAQQLALGHLAGRFLPEVIGYNLGYEQLPLHLLISAGELAELGIDPYYFQLHVTIDNASSGHAQRAVQALLDNLPVAGDQAAFLARVARGYQLNDLGLGSRAVIESFDLNREVLAMLERKRQVAGQVHADRCRIGGRTVNDWLSTPAGLPAFLSALEAQGWILRGREPSESRFWRLIEGERPAMFGVFNAYERQLLSDWIAGDAAPAPRHFRATPEADVGLGEAPDPEVAALQRDLGQRAPAERLSRLIELMSPGTHHTQAGLMATRLFAKECRLT